MIKFMVVVMTFLLFAAPGCAYFKQFMCSPTAAQVEAANVGKAVISTLLVAATVYTGGNAIVTLLNQNAIPVFDKVVAGYCVLQSEWDSAANALELANSKTDQLAAAVQTKAPMMKAGALKVSPTLDVNGAIEVVKRVVW